MKTFSILLSLFLAVTGLAQSGQTFPRTANTATALSFLPLPPVAAAPTTLQTALLLGVSAVGDNGGLFYWDYTSTAAPDGQNYFLSTNSLYAVTGRWIRFPIVAPTPGQVSTPTFSPSSGTFSGTVDVSISTTTSGAAIYYTIDGSTPTSASTLYAGAITITTDTLFKAIGILSGYTDSNVASKQYSESTPTFVVGWYGSSTFDLVQGQDWDTTLTSWSLSTVNYNTAPAFYTFPATIAAGGTAAGPYRYYIVQDSAASASAVGGFFVSLNLGTGDFAGVAEGYPNIDDNNWPIYRYDDGIGGVWRIYRLLNELNGEFTLRVQQF